MRQKFTLPILIFAIAAMLIPASVVRAQDEDVAAKYSKKPLGITWTTNITMKGSMDYINSLGQQHGLSLPWQNQPNFEKQMEALSEEANGVTPANAKGQIYFLKKGFPPTPVTVNFRTVADKAEFRNLVTMGKARFGVDNDRVKLEGDDDRYSVVFKWGEAEGQGFSTYYSYRDGVMYDANFEDVYEMDLPAPSYLSLSGSRAKYDMLAEFNLKEIPKAYKDIAWSMLSSQTGPMLQQFDDEDDDVYDFRRAAGDIGIASIKEVIFGIERVDFKTELIKDGQPLKFDLDIQVRQNSPLSKTLGEIGKGKSRFASVIDDDAALTIATTWAAPDALTDLGVAGAKLMRSSLEDASMPDRAKTAMQQLANTLEATSKDQKIDAFLKFGLDSEGEFVFYGAMAMDGYEDFVQTIPGLLDEIPLPEKPSEEQTENGVIFSIPIPNGFWTSDVGIDSAVVDMFPTKINFLLGRSALWLSIGRDASSTKISEVILKSTERGGRTRPDQLLLDLDVTDWANGESDSKPRMAIQKLELMLHNMTDFQNRRRFQLGRNNKDKDQEPKQDLFAANKKSRSFMEESLATDGFGKVFLTLGKKSVKAEGEIGDGLARFVVLRYLSSMSQMMEASQERMEEQRKRAEKELEKPTEK